QSDQVIEMEGMCKGRALSVVSRRGRIDGAAVSFSGMRRAVLRGHSSIDLLRFHWLVERYPEPAAPPPPRLFQLTGVSSAGPNTSSSGWAFGVPHWAAVITLALL